MSLSNIRIGVPTVLVTQINDPKDHEFLKLGPTTHGVTVSTTETKEGTVIKVTFIMLGKTLVQVGSIYRMRLRMPPDINGDEEVTDYKVRLIKTVHTVGWNEPETMQFEFVRTENNE